MQKIERPLLVDPLRWRGAAPPDGRQGFAGAAAHRQAFFAVQALHPLVVDDDPFPPQQDVQAPVAKARTPGGQVPQPGT